MISLLTGLIIIVVPVVTAWTWKPQGNRRLVVLTAVSLLALVAVSLLSASARFGNRLAETEGYWPVASRILLLSALTGALPILCVVAFVYFAARSLPRITLGLVSVVIAILGWFAGILMSLFLYYR